MLRRPSNYCLFLDTDRRCGVYERRPTQCRAYPYLWTRYYTAELDVDFSCPGLGAPDGVPRIFGLAPPEDASQRQTRETAIQQLAGLLHAQQRYALPEILQHLGAAAVDALAEAWEIAPLRGAVSLAPAQTLPLAGNLKAEADLQRLEPAFALTPIALTDLLAHRELVIRHFERAHRNTRLAGNATGITIYRFFLADRALCFETEVATRIPLDDLDKVPWSIQALEVRRAYLARWGQRQLTLRLANNLAVARLWQGAHTAQCYLEFLLEIDQRLAILAPALAQWQGKAVIERDGALEAIRGSDNLLRAWCESAQITLGG